MGNCQNYGPFLGPYSNTGPNLGYPKRDHNFDNHPNNFQDYDMSHSLNSLKGGYIGDYIGDYYRGY